MHQHALLSEALEQYQSPENHNFYIKASEIEAIGYGQWVRLRETVELCKSMGYRRIGMAFAVG